MTFKILSESIITRFTNSSRYDIKPKAGTNFNRNHFIKAKEVLVIDETGEKLGIIALDEAISMAMSKELDLIEVAPNADPPVTKIMSWSKFQYEQNKKRKESKSRTIEQKEMWFKAFIGDGDLFHKLKKVKEFIDTKHPVKISIRSKGRVSRDHLKSLMDRIIQETSEYAEADGTVKYQGRNIGIIIKPRKHKIVEITKEIAQE